jgi:hypothetical protein
MRTARLRFTTGGMMVAVAFVGLTLGLTTWTARNQRTTIRHVSEWGELFGMLWIVLASTVPLVLLALYMHAIGRMGTRTLLVILAIDAAVLGAMAACLFRGRLLWSAWMVFVFWVPFALMALLMYLVGRIEPRTLFVILLIEVVLGTMAIGPQY